MENDVGMNLETPEPISSSDQLNHVLTNTIEHKIEMEIRFISEKFNETLRLYLIKRV